MKTDYKNLNSIESFAVVFAAAGLLLIGAIGFTALPEGKQVKVAQALEIFDMHEQLSAQAEGFVFLAYDLPQTFLSEFNTAFTEVAVVPYETILSWQKLGEDAKVAYGSILDYSEIIAVYYRQNFIEPNSAGVALLGAGKVSGASMTARFETEDWEVSLLENIIPPEIGNPKVDQDLRGRGYEPPALKEIFKKALMLMEE